MIKTLKVFLIALIALILLYFIGPVLPTPDMKGSLPAIEGSVENWVNAMEKKPGLIIRPGCEAKIGWANDSLKQPTEFVLLYLHGFSASRREGAPLNEDFCRQFGCNAFYARLADHGLVSNDALLQMKPDLLYASAREALAIASQLGKKVVIMACSTGCTLALQLAADFPDKVFGMILLSPNVQIKNKTASLLSGPWGLQIARANYKSKYRVTEDDPNGEVCKYWNCTYRVEAIVYLQQLLDATMTKETFAKVKCPVMMGYYYKNEAHQDQIVEVKAAINMMKELGTLAHLKRSVAFPDAGAHVIACDLISKSVPEVTKATFAFASEVLGMK